jgi:hypothetical protein
MNKSNNDNIKAEKTQLTNNANRLAEKDLEHISELTGQDWEAVNGGVSGGIISLLALGAARIIIPPLGRSFAKEVIKDAGSELDLSQGFGGGEDILL